MNINKPFRRPALDTSGLAFPKPGRIEREQDPELPRGVRQRKNNSRDDHVRIICETPEAQDRQREGAYERCGGSCEGCGIGVYLDVEADSPMGFDLDHIYGRGFGGGKRCDCLRVEKGKPTCVQVLCRNRPLENGEVRLGCHNMKHNNVDRKGKFKRATV